MQIKKSREVDLERKKPTFLLLGIALACALVLSAFEWRIPVEEDDWECDLGPEVPIFETEIMPISFREEPKPKQAATEPQDKTVASIIDSFVFTDVDFPREETYPDEPLEPVIQDIAPLAEPVEDEPPMSMPDVMPQFPGGELARHQFLANHISFTAMAKDAGISGKVFVEFTVGIDGKIKDIELKKGLGAGLDEQALRAVEAMPNWEPGFYKGRPVSVRFVMPIHFNLVR
jgi:protein TonB